MQEINLLLLSFNCTCERRQVISRPVKKAIKKIVKNFNAKSMCRGNNMYAQRYRFLCKRWWKRERAISFFLPLQPTSKYILVRFSANVLHALVIFYDVEENRRGKTRVMIIVIHRRNLSVHLSWRSHVPCIRKYNSRRNMWQRDKLE